MLSTADFARESRVAPLHVDEPRMLNRGFMAGRLYREYLATGRLDPGWEGEVWQARKPPLGNLIVAAALRLGGATPPPEPYRYDWLHDYAWNAERGQAPSDEVVRAGRLLTPLFAAAAVVAVFLLGGAVGGIGGGLVAAGLFHFHPVVRIYGTRALADVPMMAASLWALWWLVRRVAPAWEWSWRGFLRRVAVFGLLVGVATAIKQNAALVGAAGGAALVVWGAASAGVLGVRAAGARTVLAATLLGAVAFGVYVLVNPALHARPLGGTVAQVDAWNRKFAGHWKARPEQALRTTGARAAAVGRVIAGARFPVLPWPWVPAALAAAGTLVLAVHAWRHGPLAPATIVLLWSGVTLAGVTLWIPLDWDRYYLPLVAVVAVLAGGVVAVRR
ncbi:MAG TPA: hypothetical protein VKA21_13100 [Candidatus Binatia bacterium]|nr:hypothetical protein [Candidatus Binatia bacterium]